LPFDSPFSTGVVAIVVSGVFVVVSVAVVVVIVSGIFVSTGVVAFPVSVVFWLAC